MKPWAFGMLAVGVVLLGGIWLVSNKNKPTASQAPTHATQPNPIPLNPELRDCLAFPTRYPTHQPPNTCPLYPTRLHLT
jgi:hypothetical protein